MEKLAPQEKLTISFKNEEPLKENNENNDNKNKYPSFQLDSENNCPSNI